MSDILWVIFFNSRFILGFLIFQIGKMRIISIYQNFSRIGFLMKKNDCFGMENN